MTMLKRVSVLFLFAVLSLTLAGCDTAEERAQKHYEKGLALLDAGDMDRAMVEFRNVFKLNGFHKEARLTYAALEEQRGDIQAAYGHYLRLIEQYPDNVQALGALARLAAEINNWDEAERYAETAAAVDAEDPNVRGVRLALAYRDGMRSGDLAAIGAVVAQARAMLEADATLWLPRQVVIDDLIRREDWEAALTEIDAALAHFPDNIALYQFRLGALERLGREDDLAAQLRAMALRFPDAGLHTLLVNRYVARGRLADAEAYLRERIAANPGDADVYLELFSFLQQQVGQDAVRAEVERWLAEESELSDILRSVRALLDFEAGQRDAAIAETQDILSGAAPSEETDRIRLSLARMLDLTGNRVGARAAVEQVLERDPGQVAALKLKAAWLIDEDRAGDALVELRTALDQAPRDSEAMTLMAKAHERVGNHELMGEMLALAADASGQAPAEALQYAAFLLQEEKLLPAEDVLLSALRLRNAHPQLLGQLGNVYIRMGDWLRAGDVIDRLNEIGSEESRALANELTARSLAGQERAGELESFLIGLANGESGLQAAASVVRLRLAQGDVEGARAYMDALLAEDPNNPALRFINAGILAIDGQAEEASAVMRTLLAENPNQEQVWMALYNLRLSRGEKAAAESALNAALEALPQSVPLRWAKATEAETKGDYAAAIAIYETLYAENPNSLALANNLASLISSYDDREDALQRAYAIARRLRGTQAPALQDTYGWIAFQLGNVQEALDYLEPAAQGLSGDPAVQYHLGEAYAALGRPTAALAQYRKAMELAANLPYRPPFMDRVADEIVRLTPVEN